MRGTLLLIPQRAVAIFNLSKNAQPNKTRADRISYRFILEPVVEDSQLFFIVILIIIITI